MLAKLMKNDFIQTGRMFLWVLGIGIGAGGIGALITSTREIGTGQLLIAMLWNVLLMLGAFVLQFMGVVIILVSTNRSLFSERGYLTFALPVSTLEMLTSKFLTNVILMLASLAEVAGLVYVAVINIRNVISKAADNVLAQANLGDFRDQLNAETLGLPSFAVLMKFFAFVLIVVIFFFVLAMMIALFVLTVSHVRPFQAKPGLWIFVFIIGTSVICYQIISLLDKLIKINVPLNLGILAGNEPLNINMIVAVAMLGLSAGLFVLTNWMLSRKISLK